MNAPSISPPGAPSSTVDLPPGVTVVVPVYNSADQLGALASAIDDAMAGKAFPGAGKIEVIFVNDASNDSSWDRIVQLTKRYDWARGLDLSTNVGQHAALIAGASAASGGVVVTMDDDLQHPPEEIGNLVGELRRRASKSEPPVSLVYGTPLTRGPLGFRRTGSYIARVGLACRMRSLVALRSSAFRAFDARHAPALAEFDQRSINLDAALVALGARAVSVRTAHGESLRAESRYGVRSLVRAAGAVFMGPRIRRRRASAPAADALQVRARVGFTGSRGPATP